MKRLLAIWVTKTLILVGRLVGKRSSSTPGSFALKICPDILKILSSQVKYNIYAVCGTNGKTTTNNLLNSVLLSSGKNVVCNNVGANMLPGVVTAFVEKCSLCGKFDVDYACLEVDEISTIHVFEHLKPDYVVITNLFRDQMDRYGAVESTMDFIKQGLDKCKDTKLVLNGDDPLLVAFGENSGKECIYYGVSEDVGIAVDESKEGKFCMTCGEELEYNFHHYSQLGDFKCPKCGFARPTVDFEAQNVNLDNGIAFDVNETHFAVKYRGFYNIYNILAAYAVLNLSNVDVADINKTLQSYKPQIGRMEEFNINGKNVILNLAKNPAGFNQALATVMGDKRKKNIIFAINDKAGDGIDVTWLWDVDFELMSNMNADKVYSCGIRYDDLSVRLKYADIDIVQGINDMQTAIKEALLSETDVLYVLVNYTALFSTHDILKDLEAEK